MFLLMTLSSLQDSAGYHLNGTSVLLNGSNGAPISETNQVVENHQNHKSVSSQSLHQQQQPSQTDPNAYLTYSSSVLAPDPGSGVVLGSSSSSSAASAQLNLPDSPPDSGSEPPFSPVANETASTGGDKRTTGSDSTIQQPAASGNRMENIKHYVDYPPAGQQSSSATGAGHHQHKQLETSLSSSLPHQLQVGSCPIRRL